MVSRLYDLHESAVWFDGMANHGIHAEGIPIIGGYDEASTRKIVEDEGSMSFQRKAPSPSGHLGGRTFE